MPGKYARKKKRSPLPLLILLLAVLGLGLAAFLFKDDLAALLAPADPTVPSGSNVSSDPAPSAQTTSAPTTEAPTTVPPTTAPPETEPVVAATASFTVTGDLLMHRPVFDDYEDPETGEYDFDPMMEFLAEYVTPADYAIANLETTFCGLDNGFGYSGNPFFNCPDPLAETSAEVGFDMLLTANNHCYDTRVAGVKRTLEVLADAGLDGLGTRGSAEVPNYLVKDVNGIRVGMTCYTFETPRQGSNLPCLNAIQLNYEGAELVNTFHYSYLGEFYKEIGQQIQEMNEAGAEAIVVFMHWGEEYELSPNNYQKTIAQKLCDMGVDVIIGGHPHVVQPVELLTASEDESHKTLCIYSLGNLISNQRAEEMRMKTGHTEDGLFFNFTFTKYTDGTVLVSSIDAIPIWVQIESYRYGYHILPLDDSTRDQWKEKYGIDDTVFADCEDSYQRTMDLVGPGIAQALEYYDALNQQTVYRLQNPELFTEPTETATPTETAAPTESTAATE